MSNPMLVVDCDPGYKHWNVHGKAQAAYIAVGAVIDTGSHGDPEGVTVQYRLDDGKVKSDLWSHSTNFSAIFLGASFKNGLGHTKNDFDVILGELLYTHKAVRKEKTSVPTRKAVIQVAEYLGGNITMEFLFPDPTEVADSCGLFVSKN